MPWRWHMGLPVPRRFADPLEACQTGAVLARATLTRLWEGVGAMGSLVWGVPQAQALPALSLMTPGLPRRRPIAFDFNPLPPAGARNRFRCAFRGPQAGPGVVCATNVHRAWRDFSGARLSADAVMASACLPMLFKAVEIDGELYWDGGYSGNRRCIP